MYIFTQVSNSTAKAIAANIFFLKNSGGFRVFVHTCTLYLRPPHPPLMGFQVNLLGNVFNPLNVLNNSTINSVRGQYWLPYMGIISICKVLDHTPDPILYLVYPFPLPLRIPSYNNPR